MPVRVSMAVMPSVTSSGVHEMSNYPKGAGLGRDPNPKNPTLVDYGWTMQHGGRAQRRAVVRQLKAHQRQGVPGADEAMQVFFGAERAPNAGPVHCTWRVTLPGRPAFLVSCAQGATAEEMLRQWPNAKLEPGHGK